MSKFFFMKPIAVSLIFAAALCYMGGCKKRGSVTRNGKINVTTVIFAPYDFVREIAGERVNLTMLIPPGSESHSFEPSPRDIITVQNSNLFIYVGGESEQWVDRILNSMDTGGMKILALMDTVEAVQEETVEGMEEEEGEGEEDSAYDEHVWTSPQNAILIVRAITGALCEIDRENADYYRQNAADYITKLNELDSVFKDIAEKARRKTIVFGDRFPFRYFADAYGLSYYAAFPGCSTETEPSAATIAFLIDKVKGEQIPVVFHIELSNERMADTICEASGAKKLLLHACHNISKKDFDNGISYLDIMKRNADHLREALE